MQSINLLTNDLNSFILLINSYKPHVIFSSETWFSSSVNNTKIISDSMNYAICCKDRADGYRGVMIAVVL